MLRKLPSYIFFIVVLWPSVSLPALAQPLMRIAYSSISGNYTPLWIAAETGAFKEVGLDAQLVYISGGPVLTQALLAGDIHIGFSNGGSAVRAIYSGADLLVVGIAVDRFIFSMMGKPEIRTVAALKGKKLGVVRLGGATDVAARIALERNGLVPDKEVAILQIGGLTEILGGLRAGRIDAAILSPPTMWQAEKLGFHELVDITAVGIAYPNPAIVTRKTYSRNRAEDIHNFMKAYALGTKRMKTNQALTKKVLAKYTRTEDAEIIDKLYQFYAFKILQKAPYITPAAIKSAIDEIAEKTPQIKNVPATNFYDDRFVNDLETSGFLQKLYP